MKGRKARKFTKWNGVQRQENVEQLTPGHVGGIGHPQSLQYARVISSARPCVDLHSVMHIPVHSAHSLFDVLHSPLLHVTCSDELKSMK